MKTNPALPLSVGLRGRREFCRHILFGTAASCVAGLPWTGRLLADVSLAGTSVIPVRIADYPALQNVLGSVRLDIGGSFGSMVVNRASATAFYAMTTVCTHNGCTVGAYSAATGRIQCPCHGSQYAIDGQVLRGPAPLPLTRYETAFDGTTLKVTIPGLGFSVNNISVESASAGQRRIKLGFPSDYFTTYRVEYRAALTDAATPVSFSTTPSGATTLTTVYSNLSTQLTVYVDAPGDSGFFSVVRIVPLTSF